MDNNQLVIVLFGILYFLLIIFTRRKGNFEEFSVAKRNIGVFLTFTSIGATYVGAAMTLGMARDAYTNGALILFTAIFGGLAMILSAFTFAPRLKARFTQSYSIGDIVGGPRSHNHRIIRLSVGLISFWFMVSITIVMGYAGGELINNVFGFPKLASIAVMTVVVIIYSYFGGIRATIQTDAIQFSIFLVIIPLLAYFLLQNSAFSWPAFYANTQEITGGTLDITSATAILGMIIYWSVQLSGLDAPPISRFLAAKSVKVTRQATALAGLFFILWVVLMVFIGSAGAFLNPGLADNDQILLKIADAYFPGVLYGIFIIAMIGVVMSTQDTTLNTASVGLSEDILATLNPKMSDQQKLIYSKSSVIFIGILVILIAGFLNSALNAVITIFSFYVPVMIPVTLFAVLKKKHYWQSALASMLLGFIANLIWGFVGSEILPTIIVGLVSSILAYLISDLIMQRRESRKTLQNNH